MLLAYGVETFLRPQVQCRLQQMRSTVKVRQRIRYRGRLLQMKQTHYSPKPPGYMPIPISVLGSGYLRRLFNAGTQTSHDLIQQVDWSKFTCGVRGVRWHPSGSWRVTFRKADAHHNFFVNCSCYFKVQRFGFDKAKSLATTYRQRLETEWNELRRSWGAIETL